MIGLVLVSHSAALAEGVRQIAEGMTQGRVPIAAAGGIDDPENPVGTDALQVLAAVEAVYSDDGVIILMDLGSALLSAETALDFLGEARRARVFLCDAPLVEGAVAAAVQAGIGSPIEVVLAEARGALTAKQQHLAPSPSASAAASLSAPPTEKVSTLRLPLIVPNRLGLHARPAARLVALVGQYDAAVTLRKSERCVSAGSITAVMLLDARQGDPLEFSAEGDGAAAVLDAIGRLALDNFGDQDDDGSPAADPAASPAPLNDPTGRALVGISASSGLAVGRLYPLNEARPTIPRAQIASGDDEGEIARLAAAVEAAAQALEALIRRSNGTEAAIFQAHRLMLHDAVLLGTAREGITGARLSAEAAWWDAIEATAERCRQSDNVYLQTRASDVIDVGRRVLHLLTPYTPVLSDVPSGCILAASDLTPSEVAQIDPQQAAGIVLRYGGATAHAAIIARGLGIPMLVGISALNDLGEGRIVVLDGDAGCLILDPTPPQIDAARRTMEERRAHAARLREASRQPAITPDGRRIEVAANIGAPSDAARAFALGAEGVGVFRTELLMMNRAAPPDEEEQVRLYTTAAQAMPGHLIIVRTFDIGGDKPVPYIDIPPEQNPFLGYRGARVWLDQPALWGPQMRAICRASADHPIGVMFPMIGTLEELDHARELLLRVQGQLAAESIAFNAAMPVGVMIEVPAAVTMIAPLVERVDFVSLGTNDLTQYLLAADRGNARVSHLAAHTQPALLRAIRQVVEAAHARGRWVGVCGEMAGDPHLTPVLLGLGVDELSMNAPAIPEIKAVIRRTDYAQAQTLAAHLLTLASAEQVEAALTG
ncbi:MAG: phosphoenolpyruvate--protein phosphotransferase [Anaerolineae bacterium]|nr:phosphoenolpyruvate--protein phosphotransferase [Anaerolineae bacterium]NUQ04475.1 phosphoenolpyruvate--protein phosphotransferase [Anaerolineae bacterium]